MLHGTAHVTGIDLSAEAVAFGKTEYPFMRFVVGAMEALPFKDGAFEVVLCLEGLEHVFRSEARAFMAEAKRALAVNGLFLATVPLLNAGRHSGNPYHLFEYTEFSISRLLSAFFETVEQEVFAGPQGPIFWFVGKPRPTPADEDFDRDDRAKSPADAALLWLDRIRIDNGFCFAPGQPKTLASTCLAILLLECSGALESVRETERSRWLGYINSCQAPDTGLFSDPIVDFTSSATHDSEYLEWHTTYLAIHALDALGASAPLPLRFTDRFALPDALETWLDGLDWRNPWLQSNRIMSLLAALIHRVEREQEQAQALLYHRTLDWLDRKQNTHTGLWTAGEDVSLLNAIAGAYHFLPFYEYVHRPISALHQIVDRTLGLQQPDGLFAASPGGGACEDLDAIDILVLSLRHTSYRSDEVKRAAVRAYWAVWNLQNEDGSFPYARSKDGKTYSFGGCAPLTAAIGSGDVWSTWFRLLLLATVSTQFPADVPPIPWAFRRWPALGYHRYGHELSADEASALSVWIRRLAIGPGREPALVTVVVTCFNLGIYLHEAVASISHQTLAPVHVTLIDDGSTDPFTIFLLNLKPWEGVELIRQSNRGVAAARNRAIESAPTPYICCLDGDDRLQSEYLAKATEALAANSNLGFVSCYYRLFDCEEGEYRYANCVLPNMLVRNQAVGVSVFRKEAWQATGGYSTDLSGMHDWDLWIGILEARYEASVIAEVLFEYRRRPHSMYAVTSRPDNYQRLLGLIVKRHSATYQRFIGTIIPLQARHFLEFIDFHHRQLANRERRNYDLLAQRGAADRTLVELQQWTSTLGEAKDWHEQQARRWQNETERLSERLNAVEERCAELDAWVRTLQEANEWHEQQARRWQNEAERLNGIDQRFAEYFQQAQGWIASLEQAKTWLEKQVEHWKAKATQRTGSNNP